MHRKSIPLKAAVNVLSRAQTLYHEDFDVISKVSQINKNVYLLGFFFLIITVLYASFDRFMTTFPAVFAPWQKSRGSTGVYFLYFTV